MDAIDHHLLSTVSDSFWEDVNNLNDRRKAFSEILTLAYDRNPGNDDFDWFIGSCSVCEKAYKKAIGMPGDWRMWREVTDHGPHMYLTI